MTSFPKRLQNQPAFVLQHWPYSETSLLVDLFTEKSGRISVIAKGARRLKSRYRGILLPFQPLAVQFTGKGDVKTLTKGAGSWEFISNNNKNFLVHRFYMDTELNIPEFLLSGPRENSVLQIFSDVLLEAKNS